MDSAEAAGFIAERYSGSLDTRALWQWAGGRPEDVDFDEPPVGRWKKLWALAVENRGATRVSLLREMLFDRPGDGRLMGFLAAARDEKGSAWVEASRILVLQVESAAPAFDPDRLWAALQSFPALPSLVERPGDTAFALLATAADSRLTAGERAMLEPRLAAAGGRPAPGPEPARLEMEALLGRMSAAAAGGGREESGDAVKAAMNRVLGLKDAAGFAGSAAGAPGGADLRARLRGLAAELEGLRKLAQAGANAALHAQIDALFRLQGSMYALADGDPAPPFSYLCDAMIQAIWATRPRADSMVVS